jgi:hypothetical protein
VMIAPAGIDGVEEETNAPTVVICIAEELIARGGAAEGSRGVATTGKPEGVDLL